MSSSDDRSVTTKGNHKITISDFHRTDGGEPKSTRSAIFRNHLAPSVQKPTSRPLGGFDGIFSMQIEN